jgi:uncharacterized OB-fold protein
MASQLSDPGSKWWWDALESGKLLLPRCRHCLKHFFPPAGSCSYCGDTAFEQIDAIGLGRIYSWVVIHHAFDTDFEEEKPVVIAAVDLEEGPRILGRFLGQSQPEAGESVRAVAHRVNGVSVPAFERTESDCSAS